jgi:hypothetical protein
MKKAIAGLFVFASFNIPPFKKVLDADRETLKQLNATFINNFVTNNALGQSRIIHKDFVYISSSGQYVSRQQYLKDWAHGFDGYVYWDYRDERIHIFGNVALIHATNKYVFITNGEEFTGMCMYTDIYTKEKGEWKCIQAQITKLSPEHYPSDETILKKYDYRN